MCKYFGKEPDDIWFENLSPVKRLWMYESWCQDIMDKHEFARSFSIFVGSFSNAEAAQQMLKQDNSSFKSTEADFDESTRMVIEDRKRQEDATQPKRRRRRQIVNT